LLEAKSRSKTFKECADRYLEAHESDFSNIKHRKQWRSTLDAYAFPIIGNMLVSEITMHHVKSLLLQHTVRRDKTSGTLWHIKTETAKRVLDRIRAVLDFAIVSDYRVGPNPAAWRNYLETQLPAPNGLKKKKHHPAVPYQQVGNFMAKLREKASVSARALEFLILTAVRSGSVRQARWGEIDFEKNLWTIPASHTKTRREHRVPLQPQAIDLLRKLPRFADTDVIFSGSLGKPLSDMALSQIMRGMRETGELMVDAVPHGFRSTFRVWTAEQTAYPDEIRKAASGHVIGDQVQEAYQRTDLLEKRRRMMNDWADFLGITDSPQSHQVWPIRGRK
jgi:integrase